ncbi:MAG: putative Formyl-CoA transferase [Pseudonocardiales bacterium]|nr:putative Formyl-CoA transferase [Pseudonocardiales bacterium]
MSLPLEGIRIVDVAEHGFVPSAGAALAEFGAEVIKVERLDGDPCRKIIAQGMVPSADGVDYLYEMFNRNKRGIALDITVPSGRAVLDRLIAQADVFLTNQLPQVQRKLGTTPEDIFKINPKIVFARGHGQGQRGPDAELGGFDSVSYWQRGGVSHVLSEPDASAPAMQRPAFGDLPSGMYLVGGVCAALLKAARTGEGSIVDAALLNSATWTLSADLAFASITGEQMNLRGTVRSPLTQTYRTSDGRFVGLMMINEDKYWLDAMGALGLPELGEKYADAIERRQHWEELREPVARAIAGLTREELSARLVAKNCIHSFFATPQDVLVDPAAVENGYLMEHPEYVGMKLPSAPLQFDNVFPTIRRSAPRLGQHTEEILAEVGYSPEETAEFLAAGVVTTG